MIPIAPSQADLYGAQRPVMQMHTCNTAFPIIRVMVASAVLAVVSNAAVVVLPTSISIQVRGYNAKIVGCATSDKATGPGTCHLRLIICGTTIAASCIGTDD